MCNVYYTLNLRLSSGVWDRQTTLLSSSNQTGCYCALWPPGARLIYMLLVREISGRANCLAWRDSHHCFEVRASLCMCTCACIASLHLLQQAGQVVRIYARGKYKPVHGFYLLMTTLCCLLSGSERWRFIKFSRRPCSCGSTSRWASLLLSAGSHQLSVELWCTGLGGLPWPRCTCSVTRSPVVPDSLTRVPRCGAAEDEAAIHHRPTVSSEAATDKTNRINKALAQAPLL